MPQNTSPQETTNAYHSKLQANDSEWKLSTAVYRSRVENSLEAHTSHLSCELSSPLQIRVHVLE